MTVGAAEDADAVADAATLSHAVAGYGSVTTADSVAVSVTEDDTAGVTVSPTSLTIAEGGEGTYTAVLDSLPGGDVTVTPSSDNGDVTFSPAELTFTAANWNAPQTVTVRAAEDADAVADSATLSHAVAGYGSVTTADSVAVSVIENDKAGVTVSPTSLTIAEGGEGTYTAVLDSLPGGDVTVTPSSDNDDVDFSPSKLTFTTANWDTPQTVTVGAAEDDDAVDDSATLSHAVAGYGSVTTAASVAVSVTEDDTAGVTVSPTSLTIAERRRRNLHGGAGQFARRRCDGDAVERQRRRDVQSRGNLRSRRRTGTRRRR